MSSAPASSDASPSAVQPKHHAHHLKYGHVETVGYLPNDLSDDEDGLQREPSSGDVVSPVSENAKASSGLDAKTKQWRRMERQDAQNRAMHSQRRYLFRRPRALQYYRGDVLVRTQDERSSHRLELFFDLVFVGLIAVLAEEAVHDHNGSSIVRYILTYTGAWMIWNYTREIFNAFVDDAPQRVLVLFIMATLVVYGNNAVHVEETYEEGGARETTIASYLIAGFSLSLTNFVYSFYICQYRTQIRAQIAAWVVAAGLWIGAIFVSVRACIAMAVVALVIEYASWMYFYSPSFKRLMKLRYSSAVAIEHEVERFSDFVTLVHGEFLLSTLRGQPAGEGMHEPVVRAVLTVMLAFSFHGMYCNGAGSKHITHPIRKSMLRALIWFGLHLPLVSALTLCGDSTYELVKENETYQGIRWMFSITYAISMLCMSILAIIEDEGDKPGELWLSKPIRLAPRFVAALVVLFLPLAEQETINSTRVLAIAAALSLSAWLVQEFGALDGPKADWYQQQGDASHQDGLHKWKGFPTLVEPGAWILDNRSQRGAATKQADQPTA